MLLPLFFMVHIYYVHNISLCNQMPFKLHNFVVFQLSNLNFKLFTSSESVSFSKISLKKLLTFANL